LNLLFCRGLARSGRNGRRSRLCPPRDLQLCARPPGIGSCPFRRDRPVPLEKPFGAQHPLQALGAQRILVEDAGAGTSLVQELRTKVTGIIAVRPDGDKVSRMAVVSAKFEAGQVFLPERASWLADFETELFAFPGSRNDDQCDSVSQALSERNISFPLNISPETIARLRQWRPKNRLIYVDSGRGHSW
jgi:predicted phage terminase large subunit-like protein